MKVPDCVLDRSYPRKSNAKVVPRRDGHGKTTL